MEKLRTLAENFSLDNLKTYLIDNGFSVEIKDVFDTEDIEERYKISDIKEVGSIRLKQEADLLVFATKIENLTERTSKKRQFDIAKRILEKYRKFYGLFIFYDDDRRFRFSFVFKTAYGTKAQYSHYKRFTFFVSPERTNKTFINQLRYCDFTDLDSIKEAFSVEPITKEFYNEIQNWYYWALDKVKFPDDYKYSQDPTRDKEIRNAQNLIRLLTRLIFIWFFKEKGLVPDTLFDKTKLKDIVKDFGKGNNYYNAILQNLFFATLNRPKEERDWAMNKYFFENRKNFGVKSLYRYEDKFLIPPEKVLKFFEDIPFINGGLFDCLDKDKVYIDGFSRNSTKQAILPDYLFFHEVEESVDLSHYGLIKNAKVRGLIDILKSYNFTTDEATPIDQEIALDPELLGKVFENLLASYNPETETTARKATGSYYTPREIVDYMVEESLREYLKTKVPEAQDILDDLFSYSDEELNISDDLRLKLIQAIDQIKIIDPACGSGAFPMGILHKLVYLLQKLDPENEIWKEIQIKKAKEEAGKTFEIEDKQEREKLLEEINENFDESINYPDYARKLYLIENCIYGVDIQTIAIQISKLRFFISLILDQKVDRSKPNFGILPLPNLETKFVAANTLIGLEKPRQISIKSQAVDKLEKELMQLRHRYFRIRSRSEKEELQKKDKEIREKIAKALVEEGWNDKVANKIASFDLFDQNATADWFDPEWMFGVVDGFDIIIGNPPYVRQEKIKHLKPSLQQQNYQTFTSTADLYVYFYEKGHQLLKNAGILSFISSNKWMRAKYGENLRKFLKDNTAVLKIIDFSGYRVFEQTVDTNIILFGKGKPANKHTANFVEVKGDVQNVVEYINQNWQTIPQEKLSDNAWTLADDKVLAIKEKIERIGKPLKNWDVGIYYGIKTGYNEAFIIDTETRNRILANCRDEEERKRTEEIIKPVLRGRDIGKYYYEWAGLWIIGTFPAKHINIVNYPSLREYLRSFGDKLLQDGRPGHRKKTSNKWFETQDNIAYYPEFEKEKIVWAETADKIKMSIVPAGIYLSKTCFMLVGEDLKFIAGISNSKLIDWYVRQSIHKLGEKGIYASGYYMERLPIPPLTPQNQPIANQIITLVDQILSTKEQNPEADTSQLEHQIDQLVYKLYDLTEEEIEIIERKSA